MIRGKALHMLGRPLIGRGHIVGGKGSSFHGITASNMARAKTALSSGGVIGVVGDSIPGAFGAAGVSPSWANAEPLSWSVLGSSKMRTAGFNMYRTSRFGDSNFTSGGALLWDPRMTIAAAFATSSASFGGPSWLNTTDTANFSIQNEFAVDRFTLYFQRGAGFAEYSVDIGGVAQSTGTCAGTSLFGVTSHNMLQRAIQRIDLHRTGVGTNLRVCGVDAWDSTMSNLIKMHSMSWSGVTSSTWNNVAGVISPGNGLKVVPFDLIFIAVGRNDCTASIAIATFQGNLTALAGYARTLNPTCSVIIVTPPQQDTTVTSAATQLQYEQAAIDVAIAQGWGYWNQREALGKSYAAANEAGWMADQTHPSASGHDRMAMQFATMLQTVNNS